MYAEVVRGRGTSVRIAARGLLAIAFRAVSLADLVAVAERTQAPVKLDGRLEEAAWQAAAAVTLTQQSPQPGGPTPFTTQVRVLRAGNDLYFGFYCRDPNPAAIAIRTLRRDGPMAGDDTVGIVLDTYGDRRTGYFFFVNAAGARSDGLISDPEHPSFDWDGIWDARTARSADGWSAEIVIPARTLSFTAGLNSWGANFERFVARERLRLRWASPQLDSFFYDLSRAGSLRGVEDLRQGLGIELSPYWIGRTQSRFGGAPRAWQSAAGADVTWRLTPELVTVFTANTDFAETEVDTRQINLTRFPLFFPEKRAFFLEGANQFEFGLGLGRYFIPFFTRRVGLLGGRPVPIQGGVKLNGRVGSWNLAALDIQTRDSPVGPGVNLGAARVSYDLTPKFRVGTLLTRRRLANLAIPRRQEPAHRSLGGSHPGRPESRLARGRPGRVGLESGLSERSGGLLDDGVSGRRSPRSCFGFPAAARRQTLDLGLPAPAPPGARRPLGVDPPVLPARLLRARREPSRPSRVLAVPVVASRRAVRQRGRFQDRIWAAI